MASAKLMIPKRSAPYYVLTANVTVHGKRVRRYGRFDFDPTVLKTHRQRENAAIEAALVFERAEQQKADDEKDGKNTPFRDAARAYIDSKKSMLDPSVRLEGDYEQHKNKANTTAGKETMLRRICEISPAFAEMPISKVNKRECEKFLDLLGKADVRSVKGYAVLKPNAKQYKKLSCPQIAAQCSIQTKSVERVFRGERTTLKTAQEIAAALKCKPEKLFHIELDHRPIARKTIKEYAIFLRLVMQYAEREYGIDNDTQTLAVKGTRSRPVDCLHPEEVEALFKVLPRCSTLEQVIIMGLLNTGMRRGELAGLTWEDIDFDHCTVHVDKSLLIVNKGYHLTTTKEDNVRDIDVAPEFMEYLKTYRDQWLAQKHRMGSAWQTSAWTESGNRTENPCKSCAGKILSLSMILAGPSAPTTMAKLLTAWPRKRASAKSTRICFATPLSVSCSPTRTSVSLQWRLRRVMPNPARHWQFIRRSTTSGRIPSAAR